jgi:hypothetical protein
MPVKVLDVMTKGKFIYFIMDNDMILFNTLGLSGGWVFSNDNITNTEKPIVKHPTVHEFLNKNDVENYRLSSLNHLNIMLTLEYGYLYYFDMLSYGRTRTKVIQAWS